MLIFKEAFAQFYYKFTQLYDNFAQVLVFSATYISIYLHQVTYLQNHLLRKLIQV